MVPGDPFVTGALGTAGQAPGGTAWTVPELASPAATTAAIVATGPHGGAATTIAGPFWGTGSVKDEPGDFNCLADVWPLIEDSSSI